jgi:hypothetical protein
MLRTVSNKATFFSQALDALYKQARFVESLSYQAWQQAGLSADAGGELAALRAQTDAYDEPDTDVGIVRDPAWQASVQRAKKAVVLLK